MAAALSTTCAPDDAACRFAEFKSEYKRTYSSPAEEARRFEIFQAKLRDIDRLNREVPTATFAVNGFSDISEAEFTARYANLDPSKLSNDEDPLPEPDGAAMRRRREGRAVPSSWKSPDVTPVQSQGGCGSCWAFATMGCVEAAWHKVTGQTRRFSPQSLVDCDTGSFGCKGGWPDVSLKLIKDWTTQGGGAVLEEDYPYQTAQGTCRYDSVRSKAVGKVKQTFGFKFDESTMDQVLYDYGPIVIYLDASSIGSYSSGVVESTAECLDGVNHAVLLVGWGQDQGGGYWIVKNSWDTWWGEQGFFRIRRGKNTCLITNYNPGGAVADSSSPTPPTPGLSGNIAFKTNWGTFLSAQADKTLQANRWGVGVWEVFVAEPNQYVSGAVSLKSYQHGTYLSADPNSGDVRFRDWAQTWEAFVPVDVGNGKIALRCYGGKYLSVNEAPGYSVIGNREWAQDWEFFIVYGVTIGPATSATMCTPEGTCATRNRTCGTIDNGCGGIIGCGACPSGSLCTADGSCVPRKQSDWIVEPGNDSAPMAADGSFGTTGAAVANFRLRSSAALVGDHFTTANVSVLMASGFVGVGVRMGQRSGRLDGAWFKFSPSGAGKALAQLCLRHAGKDTCDDGEVIDFALSAWHNVSVSYWLSGDLYFGIKAVVDGSVAMAERRFERKHFATRGSVFVVSSGAGNLFKDAAISTKAHVHVQLGSKPLAKHEMATQVSKLLGIDLGQVRDLVPSSPSAADPTKFTEFDFVLVDTTNSSASVPGVAYGFGIGSSGDQMASSLADRLVQMVSVEKSLASAGIDATVGLAPAAVNGAAALVAPAAEAAALARLNDMVVTKLQERGHVSLHLKCDVQLAMPPGMPDKYRDTENKGVQLQNGETWPLIWQTADLEHLSYDDLPALRSSSESDDD
eukprot:m51a1_g1463 hypothetical protein (908) ;mRNA; f:226640-230465